MFNNEELAVLKKIATKQIKVDDPNKCTHVEELEMWRHNTQMYCQLICTARDSYFKAARAANEQGDINHENFCIGQYTAFQASLEWLDKIESLKEE